MGKKMTLSKLENGDWQYKGGKFVIFHRDNTCWAGSITSRDGWVTSKIIFGWFHEDETYFITNNSIYKVAK